MSKLLALTLAGLLGVSTAAAGGYEYDRAAGEFRYNFNRDRDAKAQEQRLLEQQRQIRDLERKLRDQRDQMRYLEAQRNAARQHQYQRPIQPPLYNMPPRWITP